MNSYFLMPLLLLGGVGAAVADEVTDVGTPEPVPVITATATLKPTQGQQVGGTVSFTQAQDGVQVTANVTGLTPGKHGFHVHEKGDCSDPEGKSAGGHFNPTGKEHGAPDAIAHHAGDLGNLVADEDGNATLDTLFPGASLYGDAGLIGRGLIVHTGEDDLATQPTGNAGARVACAVIEGATTP